jgi:hypothetical protein
MRTPSSTGGTSGAGRTPGAAGSLPPAQLLDALKRGFTAKLMPLIAEAQAAADAELRRVMASGEPTDGLGDSLTNLAILRRDAVRYERRWLQHISEAFEGWPHRAGKAVRFDAYTLVSDDELQAQLIGQPVIEAMERRYADVLDIIDSRLWSLATGLGGQSRPANPFAPRALVESLLGTFPIEECDAELRQMLLRHYERLCGDRLNGIYTWINTQLAEAGHAMSGTSDYASLVTQPTGGALGGGVDRGGAWGGSNTLQTSDAARRGAHRADRTSEEDAARGDALKRWMRVRRDAAHVDAQAASGERRRLSNEEFLSVLSLQQGSETPESAGEAMREAVGPHLREHLLQGASSLGMSRETSMLDPDHEDAIDLVGALLQRLRSGRLLSPAADARLVRLAYPYVRLALDDPSLFDDPDHPATVLLSELVGLWDANAGDDGHDAELHAIADESADAVANDYHGNTGVFDRVLSQLYDRLEPHRKRAEIGERRAWQSILGRERLQAARQEADSQLRQRLDGRKLLPSVADFLDDQWRQSLIHAWLREGHDSGRFGDAITVGDAILQVDADAAQANGSAVAEGLIALQAPLRACFVACGLDESGANAVFASLVAEVSQPDAQRVTRQFTPLAGTGDDIAATEDSGIGSPLEAGQVVIERKPGVAPQWLRVAWVSPISVQHLLVTRQGIRHAVLSVARIVAAIESGQLKPRHPHPPVESVLRDLAVEAGL